MSGKPVRRLEQAHRARGVCDRTFVLARYGGCLSPAARTHTGRLLERASLRPSRKVTGGVGLGQTYEVSLGQLAVFQLGRFSFKQVPSVAPGVALIGGEILRRFHLYFDYKRERMILEPNRHLSDSFPAQ